METLTKEKVWNSKKSFTSYEYKGYKLVAAKEEFVSEYYAQGFESPDFEVARLTGSRTDFTEEEVKSFYLKCVNSSERVDFLILDPNGNVIGESVLNDLDFELASANFRIAIFNSKNFGKGIGTWATWATCKFAFEILGLHRVDLSVFSFNKRAEKAYLSAGFRKEGVLRDKVKDGNDYADEIIMAILENEWPSVKNKY